MPMTLIYVNPSGGVYEMIGPHPHPYIRKDGEAVTLNRWRSCCAVCGVEFEVLFSSRLNPVLGWNGRFQRMHCDSHRGRWGFRAPS